MSREHIHIHVHAHTHTHTRTHTQTSTCLHMHVCISCTHLYTYDIYIYMYSYVYLCLYVCMCVCICFCICICIWALKSAHFVLGNNDSEKSSCEVRVKPPNPEHYSGSQLPHTGASCASSPLTTRKLETASLPMSYHSSYNRVCSLAI